MSDGSLPARTPARSSGTGGRARLVLLLGASLVLIAYPPLYAYVHAGMRGVFCFVNADAFLYLGIAERSHGGFFSFDGTTPTNGFHPLWQYLLTMLLGRPEETGTARPILITFLLSGVILWLGVAATSLAIFRYTRSLLLSLLTIPGLYYVAIGSIYR